MKALIIAPQPFFSPRGTPFSVYYRTLVTSELGVKADLLTYGEGLDVDIPGVRIYRVPRFGILGDVKVGPSWVKLFLDIFIMVWTIALLFKRRYNFVHAHEESIFFCCLLKPIFRFKLVYDMHSSLPQQLTNFKFTHSKFLIWLFKTLENTSLRAADAVITICPDLANYVNNLIPSTRKHVLIENSIYENVKVINQCGGEKKGSVENDDLTEPDEMLPAGKRLVVYAGTLEPYQGIDLLILAFKKVILKDPNALLVIVGGTKTQVKHYLSLAKYHGLDGNILFTGRVPQSSAKQYYRRATVLVSPRIDGTNTPLKIYEQLASGIPLVATNIYSHTQVLSPEVAFLVQPEPEDMARGIIAALNSDALREKMVRNAQKLYEEKYSRPIYEQKMRKVLEFVS